jgi:hypothetical protein
MAKKASTRRLFSSFQNFAKFCRGFGKTYPDKTLTEVSGDQSSEAPFSAALATWLDVSILLALIYLTFAMAMANRFRRFLVK